ncbi:MAG: lysophospholipase [Ruaniaceae bacterium]|nr:lysophospholipase [Ruaniaceae bacterium]
MSWQPDVLGPGFVFRYLELLDDDFGPARAALVRHDPLNDPDADPHTPAHPTFSLLHIHGWNDYNHNRALARQVSRLGGAFYGLDLRRFGRSLQENDLHGYVDSLSVYDEEIGAALRIIRAEQGAARDVVLMGHSTGGLIAALWTNHHPGAVRALILNAPWLETVSWAAVRTIAGPVVERLARRSPTSTLRTPETSFYSRVLSGWTADDGERPLGTEGDTFYDGWDLNPKWRLERSIPIRAGWLNAIVEGHREVASGLEITCPILVLMSARSVLPSKWDPVLRHVDSVLDGTTMAERAVQLGAHVTVVKIDGAVHDVLLSERPVRAAALEELARFVRGYVFPLGDLGRGERP